MNILAAQSDASARDQVYNVAVGDRTTLNQLFNVLKNTLKNNNVIYEKKPVYKDFRAGDVRHSQANIDKAKRLLGYVPTHDILDGIKESMPWYISTLDVK